MNDQAASPPSQATPTSEESERSLLADLLASSKLYHTTEDHSLATQFVTLAHELGHLFLKHLGEDKYLKVQGRRGLNHAAREVEEESVAYLIAHRRGITSKSQSYLAGYVEKGSSLADRDLYAITRAAGHIEDALGIAAHTLFEPKKQEQQVRGAASRLEQK